MRLTIRCALVILASVFALAAGTLLFGDEAVELFDVPDVVKRAAVEKLPGFAIRSAEIRLDGAAPDAPLTFPIDPPLEPGTYELALDSPDAVPGLVPPAEPAESPAAAPPAERIA